MDPLPDHGSKSNKLNYLLGTGTVPGYLLNNIFFSMTTKKAWKDTDLSGSVINQPCESGTLYCFPVLRIRIRDQVPFWPLDPGARMGKKSRSGSGMFTPGHISESLETIFWVKILKFLMRIRTPRSEIFLTLDPEWKNSDTWSGINIPDPQHNCFR